MFMDDFDANGDGKVSFSEFKAALTRMRSQLGQKDKIGCEYTSNNQMMADRFKHKRMGKNLDEKYKVPLTFNQSIGFKVEDERNKELVKMKRFPIVLCQETKYADEKIKSGITL